MAITAADVNKLRQMTGVGLMDCKHALVEADGDFDKAIDILRTKGQKVAAKRADRSSNEGRAIAKTNADKTFAAVVVVSCETDFVAKNAEFVAFADNLLDAAMNNGIQTRDELLKMTIDGTTVEEHLTLLTGKTGEKVELPAYNVLNAECVAAYNHLGNKLAVIAAFNKKGEKVEDAAHGIAMQIAAMNPISVDDSAIPAETKEHEMAIARDLIRQEGKPEAMVEKIAEGKWNRFLKENTLLKQDYIDNNKMSVQEYLNSVEAGLTCSAFYRLQLGA